MPASGDLFSALSFASPPPPSRETVDKAVFWLEQASQYREDQDGAVSAALARMYGITQQCALMQKALKKAIAVNPNWKEQLRQSNSLILLAHGCINEPYLQDILTELGKSLGIELPPSEELFIRGLKEWYGKGKLGPYRYWVLGRSDYWIDHQSGEPTFPLEIEIFPNKEKDQWQAQAVYIVPGNRTGIPPKDNTYLPVHELFAELEKRFFLICSAE